MGRVVARPMEPGAEAQAQLVLAVMEASIRIPGVRERQSVVVMEEMVFPVLVMDFPDIAPAEVEAEHTLQITVTIQVAMERTDRWF